MTRPARLEDRLSALDRARQLGRGRLREDEAERLGTVRTRAGDRLARGDRVVVVAFAGGTGSGKSSLFNALAGRELAEVGARRPVTSAARALAVGEPEDTTAVLDWLDVRTRTHVDPDGRLAEGLVLLDLPDHDSVVTANRRVVDRLVDRVDVLVWVVDPLKYAQRSLHEGYLRELVAHAEVLLVVLNRVDELAPAARPEVDADLRALLAAEGLGGVRVLTTSAATGEGVTELAAVVREEVASRHAVAARIAADVRTVAGAVHDDLAPVPTPPPDDAPELVAAMAAALGLDGVGVDAERAYRQDAGAETRPLLSGLLVALLARVVRPLRRWRTERARRRAVALRAPAGELPVAVRHALLGLVDAVTSGAAPRWRPRLRAIAERAGGELARAAANEVGRVELAPRPRRWWPVVAVLWTLVELVAVAGALWLLASGVLRWLQLPPLPSAVEVGPFGLPTLLLLGGLATWLVIGAVRRRLVDRGARRHRRRVQREVAELLRRRLDATVLAPLRDEIADARALAEALADASR